MKENSLSKYGATFTPASVKTPPVSAPATSISPVKTLTDSNLSKYGGNFVPAKAPPTSNWASDLVKGIAPILGDIGQQGVTGKQLFGDAVATGLNVATFFLAPEAVPEEIAGETALEQGGKAVVEGGVENAAKVGAEKAPAVAKTGLQKMLDTILGRSAAFGALSGGSVAAQELGAGKDAKTAGTDALNSFMFAGALNVGVEKVVAPLLGGLLGRGLKGISKVSDWTQQTAFPTMKDWLNGTNKGAAKALTQLESAKGLVNQMNSVVEIANSDPSIDSAIRNTMEDSARAKESVVQQASKNAVEQIGNVLTSGKSLSEAGDAVVNANLASQQAFKKSEQILYSETVPKYGDSPAELTHTNTALDNTISEMEKASNPPSSLKILKKIQADYRGGTLGEGEYNYNDPKFAGKLSEGGKPLEANPTTLGKLNADLKSLEDMSKVQRVATGGTSAGNEERQLIDVITAMKKDIGGYTDKETGQFFQGTLGKLDPTAIANKLVADTRYRYNENIVKTNPFIKIITDASYRDKPDVMMKALVDKALSKGTDIETHMKDVANLYKSLGGVNSPAAVGLKEQIVSQVLRESAGTAGEDLFTVGGVKKLGDNLLTLEKTGLLDAHSMGILKDFHSLTSDVVRGNVREAQYIKNLRTGVSPEIGVKATQTATDIKSAEKLRNISDQIEKSPQKVTSDIVAGKYSPEDMATIYKELGSKSPEQQKVLVAKLQEGFYSSFNKGIKDSIENANTAITKDTIPEIVKNFETFRQENPELASAISDSQFKEIKQLSEDLKTGNVNKLVKTARARGTFHGIMSLMGFARGSAMSGFYMGMRASDDFTRAALANSGKATVGTLEEEITNIQQGITKSESLQKFITKVKNAITRGTRGIVNAEKIASTVKKSETYTQQ